MICIIRSESMPFVSRYPVDWGVASRAAKRMARLFPGHEFTVWDARIGDMLAAYVSA